VEMLLLMAVFSIENWKMFLFWNRTFIAKMLFEHYRKYNKHSDILSMRNCKQQILFFNLHTHLLGGECNM
jgi:hypothetical protein